MEPKRAAQHPQKPIFFTLPPYSIPYYFVLINANHPEKGIRYIKKHRRIIKMVIIDSGVEIFRKRGIKEYPLGPIPQIMKQVRLYYRVRSYLKNSQILVTVPDYPDDYKSKSLWLSDKETNIERTVKNIIYATRKFPEIPWLIPVQGHNKKPKSILISIRYLSKYGILDKYRFFAVANLCVEQNSDIIRKTLKIAREKLGDEKWIHAFGINLRALPLVKEIIDSFDSMAWTRPVNSLLPNHSAKNSFERALFFTSWYLRFLEILNRR